ncbi:MAG: glycosyltransferase family 2 protein [Gammaproteobacteria bacterium]
MTQQPSIAVIIPCYNEAAAIATVVRDFRTALPAARILVFDNNSTDDTVELARAAGAEVFPAPIQGKGNVIRQAFAALDADLYVLVDGDATYDAAAAPRLVEALLSGGLDMVIAARRANANAAYRPGHRLGNRLLTGLINSLFGGRIDDLLSGYRVFSRRFVKSFQALATGFETETELTVHALALRMPIAEVATDYGARPDGSHSKLSTWRDGLRILVTALRLFEKERPLIFFGILTVLFASASILLALPIVVEFLATGLVPRFPTAILATALMILAALSLSVGLITDAITHARRELRRLAYLAIPAPHR